MLRDQFCAGVMVLGGQTASGNHEPMITMTELDIIGKLFENMNTRGTDAGLFYPRRASRACAKAGLTAASTTRRSSSTRAATRSSASGSLRSSRGPSDQSSSNPWPPAFLG
ncbi:MAG: hypothetical protein UY92_C0003G0028 [Candidatus Magasanikbacteria bacterium GW2011_GWA2_56_11]|uniref:Uncharacterized protein n=1 Tax=Candidatus Magasanikbacteria bacterium GW2011_GWA2_56_11 TaxID=1619044 RepID=A0A0G2AN98_9BACT|nr:MAG: hypothetical protein UY92_C0003G0028 [Candidatus Magasanikbacteria bacterium GW2011_GWA2_56_11]